jgi:hypothetical protein
MMSTKDLIEAKRPFRFILTLEEDKFGGVGKITQRATTLYVTNIF